jgi:hypothetical protein
VRRLRDLTHVNAGNVSPVRAPAHRKQLPVGL